MKTFFLHPRKFSAKKFCKQGSFPQKFFSLQVFYKQRFLHSYRNSLQAKNQEGLLEAKILDPFNTKSYGKNIFNTLMLVGNQRSYVLTRAKSFLSTCELLLLNIKNVILYNFLTECTSMQTNYNLKFWIHSIFENLKQKYLNLLMLGVNKKS